MEGERRSRSSEAFFGRRHGKALRPAQRQKIEQLLPKYAVDLTKPRADLAGLFAQPVSQVFVEIGFGGGEHLLTEVQRFPGTGFIGVEPFINGIAKILSAMGEDRPANLRLYDDDATRLLDWLPDASISRIDLLYPDPWPKKKHWKRRFVNSANLDRFARVLHPGGTFRFASDIGHYVNWTLLECRDHPAFEWLAESVSNWTDAYDGWQSTRYEAKALREGRKPAYLTFRRINR